LNKTAPFTIYNASAGSGKTYTLVKVYLKKILSVSKIDYYKHLLAITFTNKAVAEMKQRIVDQLRFFSEEKALLHPPAMMLQLAEECNLTVEQIQKKTRKILHHLLHHYAAFSVETIDGFNHRLIRTFAKDLKIASNFEVTLDQKQLLAQAVDQLINKVGDNNDITKVLVDYTLAKTDDDKSWDISRDIVSAAQVLLNENDIPYVSLLKEKSLSDFVKLSVKLKTKSKDLSEEIKTLASKMLQLIDESGLQFEDFNNKSLPNYFKNLTTPVKKVSFGLKWQETMRDKPLYPTRVVKETPHLAAVIDQLTPQFITAFEETKRVVFQQKLLDNILKNLTPISVINLVSLEIDTIKEEENVLPISEFNNLINAEIKNQPAPFIYERLGERYRHFFIDEFQDTSLLQWENLIPLIDNSLSQEYMDGNQGSLLLVGDAKQSIYRWRGGLPEQFMDLYNCKNPFSVSEKKVENLSINWRSCQEIINFNNSFFTHISGFFSNETHASLYLNGNQQKHTDKEGGYVKLEFVEASSVEETDLAYANLIRKTILDLREKGFRTGDICILTRTKKDGVNLGATLIKNGISVVSSETLLLQHSSIVRFLATCLSFRVYPENDELKVNMLVFLHEHLNISEEKNDFLMKFFPSEAKGFENNLAPYGIDFRFEKLVSLSLYEACEYCIKIFRLIERADAYMDGFLNLVFDFQQQHSAATSSFIEYWEAKKDSAAITTGDGIDAVRLMTIHKAKGLEFPVVLFPYADLDIYKEQQAKAWFDATDITQDFETLLINYNKEVANYGNQGKELHENRRSTLQLDNLNLLYVALTRAVEHLYIFTKTIPASKDGFPSKYNQFFVSFLQSKGLWDDSRSVYEFGENKRTLSVAAKEQVHQITPEYITTFPEDHNLQVTSRDAALWHTKAEVAIAAGALLHDLMAQVKHKDDLTEVMAYFEKTSGNSKAECDSLFAMMGAIVNHPELHALYTDFDYIESERDIITKNGTLLRPDRIVFHEDNSVTVIDYKTGSENERHIEQITRYADALRDMGFRIKKRVIIYASEDAILINKF